MSKTKKLVYGAIAVCVVLAVFWYLIGDADASTYCGVGPDKYGSATYRCMYIDDTFYEVATAGGVENDLSVNFFATAAQAGWTSAEASASGSLCRYFKKHMWLHNRFGGRLVEMQMSRYICRNQNKITRAPAADYFARVTDLGKFGGWTNKGVHNRVSHCETWGGNSCGAHLKQVRWHFERKICSPIDLPYVPDCITLGDKYPQIWIRVFALKADTNYQAGGGWG